VAGLDGLWDVQRESGLLPPLMGVRKVISGDHGWTTVGPARAAFDVVGHELRYRAPLRGFVDVLERENGGWTGRSLLAGREYGRFRLVAVDARKDVLVRHIDEAIALEETVKRQLDSLASTTEDAELASIFREHRGETEAQLERLRRRLEAHGGSPSSVRSAITTLGAAAKAPVDAVRSLKTARNARDAYTTEHFEIACYRLLEGIAVRLGDEETAEVARQNRVEEEAMARRLDERWAHVVEQTLADEGAAPSPR
jgi:ferritin-like metal-binding protein YciE